jgi:serine/threonine protein kinase
MLNTGSLLQSRYRILRHIGGGGMGDVYLAEDTRLAGRQWAIKEMSPAALPAADRNWAITAFKQEAQMLAALRHPGIVQVSDHFAEYGNWYLVMDFIQGQTLEAWLQQWPTGLPVDIALNYLHQIGSVLEFLHSHTPPIVFRDLKPGNVMVTPGGEVKLIDFGIARFFKPGQTHNTVNLGTPGYASPEHGGKGQTDPRSDVYSLGVVLHQLLTGYDPSATPFHLPPARTLNPAIPIAIEAALTQATQLLPDRRFQTVGEFRQALLSPTLPPTMVVPVPINSPQPRRPSRLMMLISGVAVLVIGAVVIYSGTQSSASIPMVITPGKTATPTRAPTLASTLVPATKPAAAAPAAAAASSVTLTVPPIRTQEPSAAILMPSDTPRPTVSPLPTSTPLPPPTSTPLPPPAPTCPQATGPFVELANQLEDRLGCAQDNAGTTFAAQQRFDGGRMYWREDNDRIYAVYRGGRWESHADTWNEGDPDYSCDTPETPPTPVRGFGKIWCSFPTIKQGLGNALEGEAGFNATLQNFQNGFILQTDDRTLVMYNDGNWERY